MAESQTLYDAAGNAVGTFAGDQPGMFVMGNPTTAPAAYQGPQTPAPTTQQLQGVAEYTTAGEVQGGDTFIPFGPVFELPDEDPGYPVTQADGGARRTFRIAPSIGLMPLLRFAHAAKAGLDTDDLEGMAALYDMISDSVHPDDWPMFMAYATEIKAEDEELMEFVSSAMEIISARPRKPRGSSSATSRKTLQRSKGSSSAQGTVIPDGAIRPAEIDGLMPVNELVN